MFKGVRRRECSQFHFRSLERFRGNIEWRVVGFRLMMLCLGRLLNPDDNEHKVTEEGKKAAQEKLDSMCEMSPHQLL